MSRYRVCSAQRPEDNTGFPENWSYMSLATRWVLGIRPDPGPLKEQPTFFTTGPSAQCLFIKGVGDHSNDF